MVEKKEEKKDRFVVAQVATQTAPAIIDMEAPEDSEERILPVEIALAKILNKLEKLQGLL